MRFVIFGSGGVGGYFGGRLAHAGNDVTFLAHGENLRALRTTGLKVESLNGDFIVSTAKATDDPMQVNNVDVGHRGCESLAGYRSRLELLPQEVDSQFATAVNDLGLVSSATFFEENLPLGAGNFLRAVVLDPCFFCHFLQREMNL